MFPISFNHNKNETCAEWMNKRRFIVRFAFNQFFPWLMMSTRSDLSFLILPACIALCPSVSANLKWLTMYVHPVLTHVIHIMHRGKFVTTASASNAFHWKNTQWVFLQHCQNSWIKGAICSMLIYTLFNTSVSLSWGVLISQLKQLNSKMSSVALEEIRQVWENNPVDITVLSTALWEM